MGNNAEKIKSALETIDKGLAAINSDKDWLAYLNFTSKFYRYSYNNIFLIYMQYPDASYVMGYKAWNKLGRYVKKGEKGIGILCPCIRKVEELSEPDNMDEYNDKEAEKVVKKVIAGFRVGYVYDISQTDGDDSQIPVLVKGLSGSEEEETAIYDALYKFIPERYSIREVKGTASKGSFNIKTKEIVIRSDLEAKQKIKSLLHELSHAIDFEMNPDNDKVSRNVRELIAESSAYVVCLRLGIDTSSYSFSYLKSWLKEPDELKQIADTVQKISLRIINGLAESSDSAFIHLKEENSNDEE